jgi:hypothetical protein
MRRVLNSPVPSTKNPRAHKFWVCGHGVSDHFITPVIRGLCSFYPKQVDEFPVSFYVMPDREKEPFESQFREDSKQGISGIIGLVDLTPRYELHIAHDGLRIRRRQ